MNRSVELVEPALEGPVGDIGVGDFIGLVGRDMPLAGDVCAVAGGLENFRDGHTFAVELALVLRESIIPHHVAYSCLVSVETGEQSGPGRAAAGGIVELCEAQSVAGEPVQIRGMNFPAIAADVGIAHVIRHDQDDVGAFVGS